ncbi:MAG: rRNA maturation RNase YbeY [Candidatus Dadabacteria bacterium]|nr:rRNA maturation RNase YbeY [Candidatus Dadabacteria bacterium]MDE0662528.1 rRNA maturation RNase YbeY [Candidatus Dadabacteria bacterium]
MEISIVDREGFIDVPAREQLVSLVEEILAYLDLSARSELCVSLVSDGDMRELNRQYRQIDTTTDVLCFPQKSDVNPDLLGDIVISYQAALRHSRRLEIAIEEELRLLIVHAVLHLLGFDHKKKKERETMREKEKEVLDYLSKT